MAENNQQQPGAGGIKPAGNEPVLDPNKKPDATPDPNNPNPDPNDPGKAGGEGGAKPDTENTEGEGGEDEGSEQGDGGETTPEAFWKDVDAKWGQPIVEIEYPENVDPLSPDGVYLRERAIYEKGQDDLENLMRQRDPRAFAYALHRANGGTDEEFLRQQGPSLPDAELIKTDVNLQKSFLKNELIRTGKVSAAVADAVVTQMEANKTLLSEVNSAYSQRQAAEADFVQKTQKQLEENERKLAANIDKLNTSLDNTMKTDSMKLLVPEAKKGEFIQFLNNNMRIAEDQNFHLTLPIDPAKMDRFLQAAYLVFSGGDVKEAINKAAKAQNTKRLGNQVKANNQAGGRTNSGGSSEQPKKGLTSVW